MEQRELPRRRCYLDTVKLFKGNSNKVFTVRRNLLPKKLTGMANLHWPIDLRKTLHSYVKAPDSTKPPFLYRPSPLMQLSNAALDVNCHTQSKGYDWRGRGGDSDTIQSWVLLVSNSTQLSRGTQFNHYRPAFLFEPTIRTTTPKKSKESAHGESLPSVSGICSHMYQGIFCEKPTSVRKPLRFRHVPR